MKVKLTLLSIGCGILTALAQTEITTTTSTGTGTITEYSPGSTFVVKETAGPVSYRYGEKVTYVTKNGKELTEEDVRTRIKVGVPVSVQFITKGEDRIIDRVEIDD